MPLMSRFLSIWGTNSGEIAGFRMHSSSVFLITNGDAHILLPLTQVTPPPAVRHIGKTALNNKTTTTTRTTITTADHFYGAPRIKRTKDFLMIESKILVNLKYIMKIMIFLNNFLTKNARQSEIRSFKRSYQNLNTN